MSVETGVRGGVFTICVIRGILGLHLELMRTRDNSITKAEEKAIKQGLAAYRRVETGNERWNRECLLFTMLPPEIRSKIFHHLVSGRNIVLGADLQHLPSSEIEAFSVFRPDLLPRQCLTVSRRFSAEFCDQLARSIQFFTVVGRERRRALHSAVLCAWGGGSIPPMLRHPWLQQDAVKHAFLRLRLPLACMPHRRMFVNTTLTSVSAEYSKITKDSRADWLLWLDKCNGYLGVSRR